MGDTVSDISVADLDILKDVGTDMLSWTGNEKTEMKCKSHQEVTLEKLMKPGITKGLWRRLCLKVIRLITLIATGLIRLDLLWKKLKSEPIAAQRSVAKLQQQVLEAQEQKEQLQEMSTVVDTASRTIVG